MSGDAHGELQIRCDDSVGAGNLCQRAVRKLGERIGGQRRAP
jgi:hypothetical protein